MQPIARFMAALAAAALTTTAAWAQPFPGKTVTIVSGYPPGGGDDTIARLIAPKLSQRLGQPVVIENRTGASGNIASSYVARAEPDGHTLLINNSTLVLNAALGMPQSFKLPEDLRYLAGVAFTPIALAVHPSVPAKNVEELVAYARQHPGLSYSSCGNGSPQHFAGAHFAQIAKLELLHVPYKGCAPAIMDGIGGTVKVLFNTVPNLDPHVQAGKLRYIGIAAQQRLPFKPDLPAVSETKGFERFEAEVWFGIMGPAKLPAPVAERLEQDILAVLRDKEVEKELANRFMSLRPQDSARFKKQVTEDLVTWKRVANELNIKLE